MADDENSIKRANAKQEKSRSRLGGDGGILNKQDRTQRDHSRKEQQQIGSDGSLLKQRTSKCKSEETQGHIRTKSRYG